MNAQNCAGCTCPLKSVSFLQCCRCSEKYHCGCVNFKIQDFNEFSKEFKESWVCPLCRCKEPKHGDNSNTPIRATATPTLTTTKAAQVPPAAVVFEYDNVTLRTRPRSSCNCSCISADSIRDIMREELDRKFNTQFREFQLKLSNLEKSFATHQVQNDRLSRENELQKTLNMDLQRVNEEMHTNTHDLTRRVCALEHLAHTNYNIDVRSQPMVSQLPAAASSDEDSAAQRKTRQRRRKERNNIIIYSPNGKPEETTTNMISVESESIMDPPVTGSGHVSTQSPPSLSSQPAATKLAGLPAQPISGDQWADVRHRMKRPSLSLRCFAGPSVTTLRAVEPRKYIHLWNMLSSTDEVKQYLNNLCPQKACTVEELKTKNNYKSFKIGVPEECFDKCFSVDVWPDNARVKIWINYKKRTPENQLSRPFQRNVGGQHAV